MLANSTLWYQHYAKCTRFPGFLLHISVPFPKSLARKHPATEGKDITYQKSVFCCGRVPWDSRFITNKVFLFFSRRKLKYL